MGAGWKMASLLQPLVENECKTNGEELSVYGSPLVALAPC